MNSDAYMIAAVVMRYVFLAIVAFILLRLFVLSLREWRMGANMRKKLRNTRVGLITILTPKRFYGDIYLLYKETVIGKSSACDIPLPIKTLKGKHAIIFERGGQMFITACYPAKHGVTVNGVPIGRNDRRLDEGFIVSMEELSFSISIQKAEYVLDYDMTDQENDDTETSYLDDDDDDDDDDTDWFDD